MIIYIEMLEGPDVGSYYLLESGMILGRFEGDIRLKDSKISSQHAKVEIDTDGRADLTDLESGNGLWVAEQRVKKVRLLPGVVFQIGRIRFRVHVGIEADIERLGIITPWKKRLIESLSSIEVRNEALRGRGIPFVPAVKLIFIQGIQKGEESTFYYGPQIGGRDSMDLELLEPGTPPKAFELTPHGRSAKMQVFSEGFVLVNNHKIHTHVLSDGDMIGLGNTLIQVSYI